MVFILFYFGLSMYSLFRNEVVEGKEPIFSFTTAS